MVTLSLHIGIVSAAALTRLVKKHPIQSYNHKQAADGYAIASHRDRERGGADSLIIKTCPCILESE